MTLTIELTLQQEAKLWAAAANGTDPESVLGELVESLPTAQDLTPAQRAEELRAMFAQWAAEDALRPPAELEAEDARWEEIDHNLAEGGVTMRRMEGY